MGLRCGAGEHQHPFDRMQADSAEPNELNILMLKTLLKTKTNRELAAVFPSIKPEQLAALREQLKIPEP